MPQVAVVMGSKSDADVMKGTTDVLDAMGITYEVVTISAHRTPEKVRQYGLSARERGIEVIIAGASYAAALPGVLAGWTDLPVIGVPLASSDLGGVDSL
jgi:5-(carboxyamino)imidazole ribonucleotide mutase